MRRVKYADTDGRKFVVDIPDDAPDSHAQFGIRVGPPDLGDLNLPLALEVRLNNGLFNRNLLTRTDVRKRKQELLAVWQAALHVDTTTLLSMYEGVTTHAS